MQGIPERGTTELHATSYVYPAMEEVVRIPRTSTALGGRAESLAAIDIYSFEAVDEILRLGRGMLPESAPDFA